MLLLLLLLLPISIGRQHPRNREGGPGGISINWQRCFLPFLPSSLFIYYVIAFVFMGWRFAGSHWSADASFFSLFPGRVGGRGWGGGWGVNATSLPCQHDPMKWNLRQMAPICPNSHNNNSNNKGNNNGNNNDVVASRTTGRTGRKSLASARLPQ